MKTKTFNKKLAINKQTITNLDDMELLAIKGGALSLVKDGPPSCISTSNFMTCYTQCTCYTFCNTECC